MHETDYFDKIFVKHFAEKQKFERASKMPEYKDWQKFLDDYDFYYGQIDSKHFNTQVDYFNSRFGRRWESYYGIFRKRVKGLDYLKILDPRSEYITTYGYSKVNKISTCCADIAVNPVANPTVYFDHIKRIHPGKNLVTAQQVLQLKINVIVCKFKTQKKFITPVKVLEKLDNLQDISSKFQNTPIGFLEKDHLHLYCLHNNWNIYDKKGYVGYPRFNLNKFFDILSEFKSANYLTIKKPCGKIIDIPNLQDKKSLIDFFSVVYKECISV